MEDSATSSSNNNNPFTNTATHDTILTQSYLYQTNNNTPSHKPLTIQQLSRLLVSKQPLITPTTLLLLYDSQSNTYGTEWVPTCHIPVLREICAQWYYENNDNNNNNGDGDGSTNNKIMGPIRIRDLAELYHHQTLSLHTRVWSSSKHETEKEKQEQITTWKPIGECTYLLIALEVLKDVIIPPWEMTLDKSIENQTGNGEYNSTVESIMQYDPSQMIYDSNDDDNNKKKKKNEDDEDDDDDLEQFFSSTVTEMGNIHDNNNNDDKDDIEEEEYESDGGTIYIKDEIGRWIPSDLLPSERASTTTTTTAVNSKSTLDTQSISSDKTEHISNLSSSSLKRKHDTTTTTTTTKKKKKNNTKFKTKNAKHWIYVSNLPTDTNEQEVFQYFSKVGVIDLDPMSQKPKIKLYRHKSNHNSQNNDDLDTAENNNNDNDKNEYGLKGDASICYARPESVELAITLLDDSYFRPLTTTNNNNDKKLSVQRAKFEQHGTEYHNNNSNNKSISQTKRKVARLAALQAVGWDEEGENGRITGGLKGLRIIVLKHVFTIEDLQKAKEAARYHHHLTTNTTTQSSNDGEDVFLKQVEQSILKECETCGNVEKITIFSKNVQGVVVVKFTQPAAASKAVEMYNSKLRGGGTNNDSMLTSSLSSSIEASYWDGVTDFTVRDDEQEEEETKKRLDEFGDWLESQEVPEEFRLNTE